MVEVDKLGQTVAAGPVQAASKADARVILFLGYNGALTVQPVSLRKAKREIESDDAKPERFSRKLTDSIQRIRLMAIREAVASNADLAFDLILAALIEDRCAYGINSPLALRTSASPVQVEQELLAGATITDIEEQGDSLCAGIEREHLLDTLAGMDADTKQDLFATLVACLIDPNRTLPENMLERLGIDMRAKWRPHAAFFARMTKKAMLDLLAEQCGDHAADNCRKLAKSDLAEEVARRLGETGWMPPMLDRPALSE